MASSANPVKAFPAVETRNNEHVQHLAAALYFSTRKAPVARFQPGNRDNALGA
jgi:hypothetical protein